MIIIPAIFWLRGRSGGGGSRACFFAFAYFTVGLLPILGLIDDYFFRFDHFQYLASIGPLALAGTALVRLSDFIIPKKPWLQSALCVGLLLIVGMASWRRTWVFKTEDALWSDTLAKNPDSWAAHNNLGNEFLERGQVDDAVAQYQKALAVNPNYVLAHNNLGLALVQRGQVDDAVARYQKALEINPNLPEARNNLGQALVRKGRVDDAVAHYLKALEITPNSAETHYNLGKAFVQKGLLDSAITQFQEVLRLKPDFRPAQDDLNNAEALVRQQESHN